MRILFLGKYPPIEGGVSTESYWTTKALAEQGHTINIVTNALSVDSSSKMWITSDDREMYAPQFSEENDNSILGSVRVHNITNLFRHSFIPWTIPYVTQLAGLGTKVAQENGCDLIYAYYLEPYAVAASLISSWLNIPYIVKHAGSDIGRLAQNSNLRESFRFILRNAISVITAGHGQVELLKELGARENSIFTGASFGIPIKYFTPKAPVLDIKNLLASTPTWCNEIGYHPQIREQIKEMNQGTFELGKPTIGIYGKIGQTKGTFDLLYAVSKLQSPKEVNILAMINGPASTFLDWLALVKSLRLNAYTWILPFLPNWRVPQFIRSCDIVCFLERDFPISFHGPRIPREVLACGTCLVCSREVAKKQFYLDNIVDGKNLVIVNDPRNHDTLARQITELIQDRSLTKTIGYYGYNLSSAIEPHDFPIIDFLSSFEKSPHTNRKEVAKNM